MHECKYEQRISQLDKEIAVVGERNKALANHVKDMKDTVKQMQRWIMTFIISMALLVSGGIVKEHITGTKASAKEVSINAELESSKGGRYGR